MTLTAYTKAIVGALIAGLGSLYQALDNDSVTQQEWVAVAIATLTALGLVFVVPNLDPKGVRQDESVQPPERGAIDVLTAVVIVVVVVGLLFVFGFLHR